MTDLTLTQRRYPGNQGRPRSRPEPDWAGVHRGFRGKYVIVELMT